MSQAPAMPLWTDALIGDTTHLSAEEFGAYLLILIATWRNNGQPFADDDARLARMCRVTTARWLKKLRPVLVMFYDLSAGTWRQKRLEKEWKYVAKLSGIQSEKGIRSGEARRLKRNDTPGTAVAPGFEPEGEPNANPQTHTHKEEGSVDIESTGAEAPKPDLAVVAGTDVAQPKPSDPKKDLYDLGKRTFGSGYGGQITKLVKHHAGDLAAALYTMRAVAAAVGPAEYLGRILSGEASTPEDYVASMRAQGMRPDGSPFPSAREIELMRLERLSA